MPVINKVASACLLEEVVFDIVFHKGCGKLIKNIGKFFMYEAMSNFCPFATFNH